MAAEELKNELNDLLEGAQSVQSLEPMKRGELKDKLLSLPDMEMRQAIEQLKDEREKLSTVAGEITALNTETRNEARTLHALMQKELHKGEAVESHEQSEQILKELGKESETTAKSGNGRILLAVFLALAAGAVIILLKYFNYF